MYLGRFGQLLRAPIASQSFLRIFHLTNGSTDRVQPVAGSDLQSSGSWGALADREYPVSDHGNARVEACQEQRQEVAGASPQARCRPLWRAKGGDQHACFFFQGEARAPPFQPPHLERERQRSGQVQLVARAVVKAGLGRAYAASAAHPQAGSALYSQDDG